ncbi:unnamed protein product [Sphenostylis stenocarpa]|uniref:Uncharacterized protein n=1 Tax=Sphenostylis stenocarpa TaxID=92480 RepID=A0AA86SNQ2_9FABA|nr:unnamed protein product [Sphenostylis stenocarpa]
MLMNKEYFVVEKEKEKVKMKIRDGGKDLMRRSSRHGVGSWNETCEIHYESEEIFKNDNQCVDEE